MSSSPPLLIAIVGPTAVGKSLTGVLVAEALRGEIVSVDSRQIYRGMEVGSGAPSQELMRRIPHYLVGIVPPDKRVSAGEFARWGRECIDTILQRGNLPILVGGSGLYFTALVDGLSPIPSDPTVRAQVEKEVLVRGREAMRAELAAVDPEYSLKVGPKDRKRLVRALEVFRLTGIPFSTWHKKSPTLNEGTPFNLRVWGLERERGELRALICQRVAQQWKNGWVEEVKALAKRYGGWDNIPQPVFEAVGYAQVIAYLKGDLTPQQAQEEIVLRTSQLAKRQMTWFRRDPRVE
ncbi:MAG: tRNA (adenosine(37)-N6)-dimethylallyltransferase MiaA, partial [bacterium]